MDVPMLFLPVTIGHHCTLVQIGKKKMLLRQLKRVLLESQKKVEGNMGKVDTACDGQSFPTMFFLNIMSVCLKSRD